MVTNPGKSHHSSSSSSSNGNSNSNTSRNIIRERPSSPSASVLHQRKRNGNLVRLFDRLASLLACVFIGLCLTASLLGDKISLFRKHPEQPKWLGSATAYGLARRQKALEANRRKDRTMDEATCRTEFPAFYPQLDDNILAWKQKGGINSTTVDAALQGAAKGWGHARVLIYNGQLYIREIREGDESRMSALLGLLYQAVVTTRSPLPSVDLVISAADKEGDSSHVAWVLDKKVDEDPTIGRWLLPDFGFAGWPEAGIASYEEFTTLAQHDEPSSWASKLSPAFWRGLANHYPVRNDLLAKTRGKPWADVQETSFHDKGDQFHPIVPMHQHCRHKYLIHSEGNSYSGRSKYLLSCQSVTIAHPLEWTQHFHPAIDPDPQSRYQNMVMLPGPLFNGLEPLVNLLEQIDQNDGKSTGIHSTMISGNNTTLSSISTHAPQLIASNAVKVLRNRYLTPAATMCYTRAALRAYASVQNIKTWPVNEIDPSVMMGPSPIAGGGVVPAGGRGKDLYKLGAKGDIEYGVWRVSGSIDWPPLPK